MTQIEIRVIRAIRELWIVDLNSDVIRTFRKPAGNRYTESDVRSRTDSISPEAFPDFAIKVGDLLG